jgi:hypothetical protein
VSKLPEPAVENKRVSMEQVRAVLAAADTLNAHKVLLPDQPIDTYRNWDALVQDLANWKLDAPR